MVIIGRRCKHVPRERAANVVFGYCAGNDVSVRDWQMQTTQWVLGKSFDTHAPSALGLLPRTSSGILTRWASDVSSTASAAELEH